MSADPVSSAEACEAAAYYRSAFALLPELTPAEKSVVDAEATAPLTDIVRTLLHRAEPALAEWKLGTALPRCHWAVEQSAKGFEKLFDSAGKPWLAGRLQCLRIRLAFLEGRDDDAVDDIVALICAGRHFGWAGTYLCKLVALALESRGIELAAAHMLQAY